MTDLTPKEGKLIVWDNKKGIINLLEQGVENENNNSGK